MLSPAIRAMILAKASAPEIEKRAVELGMRTLLDDGWSKVKQGVTTLEEVAKVTDVMEAQQGGLVLA